MHVSSNNCHGKDHFSFKNNILNALRVNMIITIGKYTTKCSSKITVFVLGKNTILKFVGYTK